MASLPPDQLHPNLLLLLQKVCVIENMGMIELIEQIDINRKAKMSLNTAIGIFCANYFAQASTLQGHASARHGQGLVSVQTASDCIEANKERYDLSLADINDYKISGSYRQPRKQEQFLSKGL